MKQLFTIAILFVLATSCSISQHTVQPPSNVDMPKHALFISQSGTESHLMQTVIDLRNNEMVVLSYRSNVLSNVIRTGIYLNPEHYKNTKYEGTDAPFKEKEIPKMIENKEKEE